MKQILVSLALLLLFTVSPAQDAPANSEPEPASPEEQAPKEDPAVVPLVEDSSQNPPPPSTRFEPSEQISEDLSVSFPIDI
ncbi:MAG: hypothetical protein MUP90_02345 [Gammaproteobacteria bacterium]|nr:hypothetical protein [Gammaproteobacteria bacterium]